MNDNSKNNGSPLVKLLDFDKEARLQEIVDQYYTQAQNLAETINKISEIDNIIPGGDEKSDLFKSFLKAAKKLLYSRCFSKQMIEVSYTILENSGPTALRDQALKFKNDIVLAQANVSEIYDYLTTLSPERCRFVLSLVNNGSILYEHVQTSNKNSFISTLSQATKGLEDLLVFCHVFLTAASMIVWPYTAECIQEIYFVINASDPMTQFFDNNSSSKDYSEVANAIEIMSDFASAIIYGALSVFCPINKSYFYTFTNNVALNIICNDLWKEYTISSFLDVMNTATAGYSIENDVINKNEPNHIIVSYAKEYLKKNKPKKGRPQKSWLKMETKYTDDEIGNMLKDEVWYELINRISEFELLDPGTEKKIEGEKREIIINALGCCFIFYSAYSLGFTDSFEESNILSSFVRTANAIVKVSRNTIKKYWWVVKEAEEWENRQPGYKKAHYMSDNKMLTLMLERNLKAIEDTKEFVKIKLDVFWRNLES